MSRNLWYVARYNELLLDMDCPEKSSEHFLRRLRGAIDYGRLKLLSIEMHHSRNEKHLHVLLTLDQNIPPMEKCAWEIVLHSDIYRTACNVMRAARRYPAPNILITPFPFSREPDAICTCEKKHSYEIMQTCQAAIRLRGTTRVEGFFGKIAKRAEIPSISITRGFQVRDGQFYETIEKGGTGNE